MAEQISEKEIEFSALSVADENGSVFFWKQRVFRAVRSDAEERIRELFSSGLVDDLVAAGLFPKTWITNYTLKGYSLILEHARCYPVTYPYEWSFSMLRDAAATVLKTNVVARKYGYQTKDCHGFNVVFDGVSPQFVDLGSFVKVADGFEGWLAYEEFLRFYCYPLKIWKDGNGYIARRMLIGNTTMPHASYLLYRYPFCRCIRSSRLESAARLVCKLKTFSKTTSIAKQDGFAMGLARWMAVRNLMPFVKFDMQSWLRKIGRFTLKQSASLWGDYHDTYFTTGIAFPPSRFKRVATIVKGLEPASVLELAGNQGALSVMLADELPGVSITCTDYDEVAVEAMYRKAGERGVRLSPALLDFVYPTLTPFGQSPSERMRADVVLALAVTHHLLLSGGLSIESVFRILSSYTKRYVLVEFMPMGLHNGVSAPPLPDWYTVDWFREHFAARFDLILEEKLEENRVLFVGTLKKQNPDTYA